MNAPAPGQTFGPYLLERVVGIGGMGVVYRARDTTRGTPVALKLLRSKDGAAPSDEARARFVREARLAAGLVHPFVVGIVASGAIGTVPYLAMEWIDGQTLAARATDPSFDAGARVEVLARIAEALAHAHAHGVVHRDLKPSNVMIDGSGTPKLVDFGIAKQAKDDSQPFALAHTEAGVGPATRTGVLLGTPSYMAPEQMISPEVDARVDQFAWGVMAYELLAGVHPRETVATGDAAFPVGRARPLAWQAPTVPEPVAFVVHRAMAYERDARFRDMNELAHTLRMARGAATTGAVRSVPPTLGSVPSVPLGAAPPMLAPPPTTMQAVVSRAVPEAATGSRSAGPKPALFVAGGALVVVALAFVVLSQRARSGAPMPIPLPGYRTVELAKGLEDVAFAGGDAGMTAAKAEVLRRVRPCIDTRMEGEDGISVDVEIDVDGKVQSVGNPNYCRRESGNRYLCTELGDPVKKGHPTPPDGMLACVRDAAAKIQLPPLAPKKRERFQPAELPSPTTLHLDLEAR